MSALSPGTAAFVTDGSRGKRALEPLADDGHACLFLDENGLCELHAEHDWKPAPCSVFPLEGTVEDGDFHISVRQEANEHCEGLTVTERR